MEYHSEKSTLSRFDSWQENKSRRNRICSEYYCWYGHEDCFSEGGSGKYSGGRGHKPRGDRTWRNNHRPRGRGHRPGGSRKDCRVEGSDQYLGFGYQQGQSIEEIKKQHSKKKREESQELAEEIAEKSEIADKAAKLKEVLDFLPSSQIYEPQSHHQCQDSQEHKSSEPVRALAALTPVKIEKLIVPELVLNARGHAEVGAGKSLVEGTTDDIAEESLISSRPSTLSLFHEDQAFPPPSTKTVQDGDDTLDLKIYYSIRAQLSTKRAQKLYHMWLETCLHGMCLVQVQGALTDVRCELGGVSSQDDVGQVDIVEVPKTLPPCKDVACEETTTRKSSSSIVARGYSYPIDSATMLAPVYKKRGKARIIGGHEVVIGCVGDLVNVQENNVDEVNNENHVEINLEIETSPDENIEQDNLDKMKSFGLIFKQESSLLSDLESVDSKMTSLAQERSSLLRQLLFLSKLKSQLLK